MTQRHRHTRSALAFDWGLAHRRRDRADRDARHALTHLKARDGIPDWDAIGRLIEEWKPDVVVVGCR